MKLAPPRFLFPAALVVLLVSFGLSGFHAEDDPNDAYVYDRTESVLHLSLDAPGGTSLSAGGPVASIGIYVQRHSWEIWRQASTGLEEYRDANNAPEAGASVNLSLSDAMGTLGDSTVITNADGFAYTTYSPDGGSGSVYVNAAVENSTASLFFDVTYTTTGYDESYSYSHTEATLVAELSAAGSTDSVYPGETRELSLSVRYETWDVMTNSLGHSYTENHTSAPAEGASVTWISESGDASVSGYGMADAAGFCQGSMMMGSGDSVVRAEVSYAAGQATSASLYFAAAPYIDPSGGGSSSGDPSTEWSYSRSETIASISNLSAGGSTDMSTGETRHLTGEVRHEVWDVWVNGNGMEDWRYNYAGQAAWTTVTAAIEFGDGSLGSTTVTSDGQGWFSLDYTMGSSSSRVTVSADGATSASGTNGSASVDFTYSSTTGQPEYGNGYDNSGTSSPYLLSYDGNYRIEGLHSDGPTYDLTPGTQRTVSGVLYWDSWEVWSDGSGNTAIQNHQSHPATWSGLTLSLAQGDGTLADSSITTDSSGGFTTTFTMGNEASRVRAEATGGSSGTVAAELDFTPLPAGPVDDFVRVRDESSLFVAITGGSPQAGTETIPLEAQVTETTWEVWENGIAPAELRNYRTGPAIAASVEFSVVSGSGELTAIDSLTDADGTARASIIPGQADTVVAANASFLTTGASGQITVSPVPWVHQSTESRLALSLQQTDNAVTATVRLQSWEIWVNPATGLGESRHESEGPAVNAEVIFQSLATSGYDASFSPPTVMTATDGTASTIYTSLDATMAQVTAHFAGQSVTETIHLPTASGANGTDNGGGTDYYGYTTNGPDGGGPDGGGPDGGGPDGGGPAVTPSPVPVNLRGRFHQTTGGGGAPGSEGTNNPDEGKDTMVKGEGPDLGPYHELLALNYSHAEYHEVTLYVRFKATLVRDLLANDGVTVTGEEEKEVEGLVVDKEEILAPELEDRWRVRDEEELDPYQGYRWEVSFGGSIDYNTTGSDANGEALEVNGRTSPSSDASLLETLASEHEIKSLYEQVGSPPDPSVYWTGSVGDMGFGAAPWSSSERLEEGGNTNSPTPSELESYADFVSGVTPSVKWSEYWGQTDAPVPADGGPAKSTVVFFAKSINEDGETTSTGTVTVTFTIEPGQRVSTDTPVIESSSGSMGSWIVAQSDGTVRAEPPVERGKRNVVGATAGELIDIKDHANTGDDVAITNWDTAQQIADNNIAWIEAHASDQNDAPRMPQLELRIPGLPQNVTLEAKLLIEYERPYVGKQTDDTVRIPADGSFQNVANDRWEIWSEYANLPFFGGDATLTYKINGGAEQTIKFAIGGRNPDDARCKAYTQGRPGAPWYAYAIEKHESQAYNPGHYNQFWERSGNNSPINNGVNYAFTKGDPLVVRSPGETGVGGAGLAQVTGAGGTKTVSAPREIFWNWQKNVDAFLVILAGKIQIAEMFMNDPNPRSPTNPMPNGQRPQTTHHTGNNVPVPSRVQGPVTFGDNQGEKRPEDAVAIKAYNGAAAHWCSWQGPSVHAWQFNDGQNNYVEAVCNQIDPEP